MGNIGLDRGDNELDLPVPPTAVLTYLQSVHCLEAKPLY